MRALKSTIAAKLILALLGSSLILIIVSSAFQLYYIHKRETRILEERLFEVEQSSVPALVNSIWLADWQTVGIQAAGIQRLPEILRVEVEVLGREIIAAGEEMSAALAPPRVFPLVRRYKDRNILLGSLRLYADETSVRNRVRDEVAMVLGMRLAVILVISSVLFFLFHRLAGRHLIAMAEYLRNFDQIRMEKPLVLAKKNCPTVEDRDEIEQLAASFNEMRQNLQRSFHELREVNEDLRRENQERIRAEEALRASEQRHSLLVNNIPQVFWMVSADYRQVLFISPAYETVWGRSCESLLADPGEWLAAVEEEDRPLLFSIINAITSEEPRPEQIDFPEYRIRRPDGEIRWIKARAVPLKNEAGRVWCFAGLCEDITEQKRADEEKRSLEARLRQAQKMEAIGTLAGGIAHDFNNILTIIMGNAELAMMQNKPEVTRQALDEIRRGSERAKDLVRQILTFSRKSDQHKEPLQLSLLVKETLKMLRASIPATIEIRQDLASEARVLADPTQLHQVIVNLCTNAYHAMREQGGILTVSLAEVPIGENEFGPAELVPGNYLRLEVSDTGCGIAPEIREKIFEPFFTTKKQGEGTGMGLAMVHGIVRSHHGHISVESAPGKGTAMRVYLPVTEATAAPAAARPVAENLAGSGEMILFVDDEPQICAMMRSMLSRHGYRIATYHDPQEALRAFAEQPGKYALVITDMTMPQLTGADLAKKILEINPELPVILSSGYSDSIDREKALAMGFFDYLYKPCQTHTLLAAVRKALARQGGA
ncbi:ATP-binding protein [Thiovibrio sp. JS02]